MPPSLRFRSTTTVRLPATRAAPPPRRPGWQGPSSRGRQASSKDDPYVHVQPYVLGLETVGQVDLQRTQGTFPSRAHTGAKDGTQLADAIAHGPAVGEERALPIGFDAVDADGPLPLDAADHHVAAGRDHSVRK